MALTPTLNIALKAARRAAAIMNRAALDLNRVAVAQKGTHDFVTEVDRACEKIIIDTLKDAYPDYAVLAEESGESGNFEEAEFCWIIDPLDGTTNFIHGFPHYAISIALANAGQIQQALIFDPNKNELFTATKGAGAYLNEKRIRVSRRTKLSEALIGTGFPYKEFHKTPIFLNMLGELFKKCVGLRRPGAASLDLAYVAAGRYDGFFEFGLKPWDIAAGALLITEAGGLIATPEETEDFLKTGDIIAATPKIFAQLLKIIQKSAVNA